MYFVNSNNITGHKKYLNNMFVHRKPFFNDDYMYYERCVKRILNLKENILFIHTSYNNQYLNTIFSKNIEILILTINKKYKNSHFLLINYINKENDEKYNYTFFQYYIILNVYIQYNKNIEYHIDKSIKSFYEQINPLNDLFVIDN